MSYRDDLEAAHARIEALEGQLAGIGAEAGEVAAVVAKSQDLERGVGALREHVRGMQARLTAALATGSSAALPVLTEHNRLHHAGTADDPAGVACPMCFAFFGELVEMGYGSAIGITISRAGKRSVACPRCEYSALKRG